MIPLNDNVPSRRFPIATIIIIIINVGVFLWQLTLPAARLAVFWRSYGATPYFFTTGHWPFAHLISLPLTLITTQFIHGGWLHLLGNMLYLWIFGDNIEDYLGSLRFIAFYLICGITGAVAHIWLYPLSRTPLVGASGAIAGILGAYLLLFPWAKVRTIVPLGFIFTTINIPALVFLGFWFLIQLWSGSVGTGDAVAYWAHVGGFVAGFAMTQYVRKHRRYRYIR